MANKKISELSALTSAAADVDADYLPIVDVSEAAAADRNKRMTLTELAKAVVQESAVLLQSGIGAVAETVEDALRRMVFSGQYSSSANFNTAQASLTDTAGVKALRLGTGTNELLEFPTQVANVSFGFAASAATFNGQVDPTWGWAYNPLRANTSEPELSQNIEGHYYDGANRWMESNLDYISSDGLTTARFSAFRVSRTTHLADWVWSGATFNLSAAINSGGFTFTPRSDRSFSMSYPTADIFAFGGSAIQATGNTWAIGPNAAVSGVTGLIMTTGCVYSFTTDSGGVLFQVVNTASASNYVRVNAGAAGGPVVLGAQGGDTTINIGLYSKGTGYIALLSHQGNAEQVRILGTASPTRYITLTGSNGGNPTIGTSAGRLNVSSALTLASLGAFAASDKYLIVDSSGNVHVSALGPAS